MPDAIFEDHRLVEIYDYFDGARDDLEHYYKIAKEFDALSVLDIGSGTGCFSCMLAEKGFKVAGLEPAKASIDIAKTKKFANKVDWILGDIKSLNKTEIDISFMTGNVAQVFLEDKEWENNLEKISHALKDNGYFVFEVRDPNQKAWESWIKDETYQKVDIPNIGIVEAWCDLEKVSGEYVSFIWSYLFHSDNKIIKSKSTLRFRNKLDIIKSLENNGFNVIEIRDAPDRPNKEFVFIAQKI